MKKAISVILCVLFTYGALWVLLLAKTAASPLGQTLLLMGDVILFILALLCAHNLNSLKKNG